MTSDAGRSFVGEIVRIKVLGLLAVVISDNTRETPSFTQWKAKVRMLNGKEAEFRFEELEMHLTGEEAANFKDAARVRFPELNFSVIAFWLGVSLKAF